MKHTFTLAATLDPENQHAHMNWSMPMFADFLFGKMGGYDLGLAISGQAVVCNLKLVQPEKPTLVNPMAGKNIGIVTYGISGVKPNVYVEKAADVAEWITFAGGNNSHKILLDGSGKLLSYTPPKEAAKPSAKFVTVCPGAFGQLITADYSTEQAAREACAWHSEAEHVLVKPNGEYEKIARKVRVRF